MSCIFFFFLLKTVIQGQVCHSEGMQIKWCPYCEPLYLFYSVAALLHPRSPTPAVYLIFFSLTMVKIALQTFQVKTHAVIHLVELTYLERYCTG